MVALRSNRLARNNPCAQCGKPIPAPVWTEIDSDKVQFSWHCIACDYRFHSTAIYQDELEQVAA
jgi:hypothetical protein